MAFCTYHRDRPGIGICMRCRAVICAECSTRLEGINYCHACLKALGRKTDSSGGRFASLMAAVLILGATWLLFTGMFWLIEGRFAP